MKLNICFFVLSYNVNSYNKLIHCTGASFKPEKFATKLWGDMYFNPHK